jgi:uncharacterized protein (TIGR02246 family)
MTRLISWALGLAILAAGSVIAQRAEADADLAQVLEQYQNAWNQGDAKALASLYTRNAIRVAGYAEPLAGREAIEKSFATNFARSWKGTRLRMQPARTEALGPDVRLQEGTYELQRPTGEPQRGRYLNTFVRESGQWLHAGVALIPYSGAAR